MFGLGSTGCHWWELLKDSDENFKNGSLSSGHSEASNYYYSSPYISSRDFASRRNSNSSSVMSSLGFVSHPVGLVLANQTKSFDRVGAEYGRPREFDEFSVDSGFKSD